MLEKSMLGIHVSSHFRAILNAQGIPWNKRLELGEEFNRTVESADWISTDKGVMFEKTFVPEKTTTE